MYTCANVFIVLIMLGTANFASAIRSGVNPSACADACINANTNATDLYKHPNSYHLCRFADMIDDILRDFDLPITTTLYTPVRPVELTYFMTRYTFSYVICVDYKYNVDHRTFSRCASKDIAKLTDRTVLGIIGCLITYDFNITVNILE